MTDILNTIFATGCYSVANVKRDDVEVIFSAIIKIHKGCGSYNAKITATSILL